MSRSSNRVLQGITALLCLLVVTVLWGTIPTSPVHAASLPGSSQMAFSKAGTGPCLQPTSHSDLQSLSDEQLAQEGFPTHAVINLNPQQWAKEFALARSHSCGTLPDPHIRKPAPTSPAITAGQVTTPNWAGYIARGGRGTYKAAMVTFNVPALSPTVSGAHADYWAGIGDGYTNPTTLVQDGVDTYLDSSGNTVINPWWEIVSSPGGYSVAEQALPLNGGVHVGDQIWTYVNSNPNGSGSDWFYIQDNSTGAYNSYSLSGGQYLSDSASGECIVEAPSIGGGIAPLADFGWIQMQQCQVYVDGNPSMYPIGNYPNDSINMVNSQNILDAATSGLWNGGQNFGVTWEDSQTG